jgi:nucleotidyltransferase/DNA polymerase involved in DNA repair
MMASHHQPRVILHLDMDAFFAAVEVRDNPDLAGKPVIIGHPGPRGVVATCSYEARRFGVRSAMPSATALRLCPDGIWVRGRMERYSEISRAIRQRMRECTPLVEPLSIDEAFLDLTGIVADLQEGGAIGRKLKDSIIGDHDLTSSVGVAPNKFLAKIASDLEKPDGLVLFPQDAVKTRLWPMEVERLWGVGPKTGERLKAAGVTRIGYLANRPESAIASIVGQRAARHLQALSRGEDDRPVVSSREAKSISSERTYETDLADPDDIDRAFLARSEHVARELRKDRLAARTVHIKIRTGDFTTWTRAATLAEPTDLAETIVREARNMYSARIELHGKGVRLLGIGTSHLVPTDSGQPSLFPDPAEERARKLARATDAVRDRMGEKAVTRARLLKKK